MLTAVLLLLAAAACCPWIDRRLQAKSGWFLSALSACLFFWFAAASPGLRESLPWMSALQVDLDFHLDGFGRLFALLITGIGAVILLYAPVYLEGDQERGRFLAFLLLFQASMLGVAVADNFLLFFVFWELTGLSSYLLISHYREEEISRWNALQALLVTGLGGLSLLAGLLLLGLATGEWKFSTLLAMDFHLSEHPHYPYILALVLLGALTKSAQFPFHFWLPNAMVAPTPTSAFLHSATMVKAGILLLVKISPLLAATEAWSVILVTLGGLTAALGAGRGLIQTDLKKILAWSTLSVLGLLTLLLGLGTELAQKSALLLLCGHALYKAALFLTVGNLDHATGTREITRLGGCRRAMPWTAAAALLASFSMAGFPPFFGFLGKEYIYKSSTYLDDWIPFLVAPTLFANMLLFAMALKVGWHPFWSTPPPSSSAAIHECRWEMWAGPLLLGWGGLLLGLFPQTWLTPLLEPALADLTGRPVAIEISLWHGFQLPLFLSLVTVTGGAILYLSRKAVWRRVAGLHPETWTLDGLYRHLFQKWIALSRWHTTLLQSGSLSRYLTIILLVGCTLLVYEFAIIQQPFASLQRTLPGIVEICLFLLATGGAALATFGKSALLLLTGLGAVGFTISVYYVLYAAPDLAITQILVETLTLVLFVLVIRRLPRVRPQGGRPGLQLFQAILAGTVGLFVCLILLKAQSWQVAPSIGSIFGELSYPEAKGKNVVNVILVDFRALDTLGEITVLTIAALGVATLTFRNTGKEDAP